MYIHIDTTHFAFVGYTCTLYRYNCRCIFIFTKNTTAVIRCYSRKHVSLLTIKYAPENKTQK